MVVHRDLKPENILFRRPKDNDIIITDLGLATRLHYYQDNYGNSKGDGFIDDLPGISDVTFLPGYYGTMGYTAPEVLLGLKQGVKIDSWAIGYVYTVMKRANDRIITYQMLSTAIPWRYGVNCDEHMMEICTPKIVFQERYWGRKSIGGECIPGVIWVANR
jgi:calcium/calmodulin-dependent protein kinase I